MKVLLAVLMGGCLALSATIELAKPKLNLDACRGCKMCLTPGPKGGKCRTGRAHDSKEKCGKHTWCGSSATSTKPETAISVGDPNCPSVCLNRTRFSWTDLCTNSTVSQLGQKVDCTGCADYAQKCSYCHHNNGTDGCIKCFVDWKKKIPHRREGTVQCRIPKESTRWGACSACHEECGDRLVVARTHNDAGEYAPVGHCMNPLQTDTRCLPMCYDPATGEFAKLGANSNSTTQETMICTKMCEAAASFKLAQDNETKKALNITEFTTKGDDKIYVRCSLHKVTQCTQIVGLTQAPVHHKLKHHKHESSPDKEINPLTCNVTKEVACSRYKIGMNSKWTKRGAGCPSFLCKTIAITA